MDVFLCFVFHLLNKWVGLAESYQHPDWPAKRVIVDSGSALLQEQDLFSASASWQLICHRAAEGPSGSRL